MSKYSLLTADLSNPNSPATKIARLVGRDKAVLDVGCAHGYLGEVLQAQGCQVLGVERDPEDAERARARVEQVVVADVEETKWTDVLATRHFDVVVLADVLEHLLDPALLLRRVRALLSPEKGFVVASVPNVAHVSVRLELLLGSFRPEECGILDATHRHFFTRETLHDLFASCGLAIDSWDCTTMDLSDDVIGDYLRRAEIPYTRALRERFHELEAIAYQFIITARPSSAPVAPLREPISKPLAVMDETRNARERLSNIAPAAGGLRVLQVIHQFLPRHAAGTEIYCADLSVALARRGHVVRVLSGAPHRDDVGTSVHLDGDQAILVERVAATRTYRWLGAVGGFFDRFDNPEARPMIGSILDRMRPDVVHVQHLLYLSVELIAECRARGIPVVVMLNDYWFLCHRVRLQRRSGELCEGPARGWNCCQCLNTPALMRSHLNPIAVGANLYRYQYLTRRLLEADRILSPSRFLRDLFVRCGLPPGRIEIRDYGTTPPTADMVDRLAVSRPRAPVRFGYLGSLMQTKGVHVLIDAFNQMPEDRAELHIFGASPEAEYDRGLHERAHHRGIHWRGALAHADRWQALEEVDVLVVPSIWYENSPLTIHEALMARVPVIGSRMGGIPELVEHGVTGFTYPAEDVAALMRCLRQVVDDPMRVRRWQERITPPQPMDRHAAEIEALYRELVATRPAAARSPA